MLTGIVPVEMLGVAVFAVSGAVVAARKGMDPVSFIMLGVVTAIGGGSLRDLLLARPVSWIADPTMVIIASVVAVLLFMIGRARPAIVEGLGGNKVLLWADAAGLALFAVTGTLTALKADAPFPSAVALGAITATFGGILRDVLAGEPPILLHSRDLYVTAAAAGAITTVACHWLGLSLAVVMGLGCLVGFALRAMSILAGWSLPDYPKKPPPTGDRG
jgi:uncharacterized membrane protein YeiH